MLCCVVFSVFLKKCERVVHLVLRGLLSAENAVQVKYEPLCLLQLPGNTHNFLFCEEKPQRFLSSVQLTQLSSTGIEINRAIKPKARGWPNKSFCILFYGSFRKSICPISSLLPWNARISCVSSRLARFLDPSSNGSINSLANCPASSFFPSRQMTALDNS